VNAQQRAATVARPEFEHVFSNHCRFVWRALARLGVQSRDVPDACQEVFLVVHRRLDDFEPSRSALSGWLYGICLRVASDYRRRNPSRNEAPLELLADPAGETNQSTELEQRRAWQRLADVLSQMGADKADVFVLYELEGVAMSEVASLLHCPLQTAYARLHAARKLVLEAFGNAGAP
jgi:RNA polymerase sigma-70 factor, ECF subfamily